MYCAKCGSQIQAEVKFCKHCGTNLTLISDWVNGKPINAALTDDLTKLLEKCHRGYLSTLIGSGLIIGALMILLLAMLSGRPTVGLVAALLIAWAIPAIAQGASRWLSAKSEIKSLLADTSPAALPPRAPEERASNKSSGFLRPREQPAAALAAQPASVTEGTTRELVE